VGFRVQGLGCGVCGTEAGSYLRLIDSCITQLKAQGPSRTCNESKEEEEEFGVTWVCASRRSLHTHTHTLTHSHTHTLQIAREGVEEKLASTHLGMCEHLLVPEEVHNLL